MSSFVNFDPNKNSQLGFLNDRVKNAHARVPSIEIDRDDKVQTPWNIQEYLAGCEEGTVLLWKSHLIHGFTAPDKGENNRLTLSFNTIPKICSQGDQFSFSVSSDNRV